MITLDNDWCMDLGINAYVVPFILRNEKSPYIPMGELKILKLKRQSPIWREP